MKKERVSNCEVAREFIVTQSDVSPFVAGQPDNTFKCPVVIEYTPLVRQGGKIVCKSPACRFLDINDTI